MTWDVVIAGAGPAGTVAATILARAGVRVLIIDRARFPRDKLCGDSLNPGTLAVLHRHNLAGWIEQHGRPLDGMLVCGHAGARVAGRYPRALCGRTIRRRELDQWLLGEAIRAGAQFEPCVTVRSAVFGTGSKTDGADRVVGIRIDSETRKHVFVPSRVTIAADGRRSTLTFGLGLAAHPGHPRRWAIGAYFDGVADISQYGEMHVRPGEYIGVAPMPNTLANVCAVGTRATLTQLSTPAKALLTAICRDEGLRGRFDGARLASRPVILGPLAVDTRAAGMPGLLLAGDAAGFIDPITGDGLRFAIRGAELAAEVALEMLNTGSPHGHVTLAQRRRKAFRGKWLFNRALRRLVDSPAALHGASVAASIAPAAIQGLVAIAGDCGTLNGNLHGTYCDDCGHVDGRASAHSHAR